MRPLRPRFMLLALCLALLVAALPAASQARSTLNGAFVDADTIKVSGSATVSAGRCQFEGKGGWVGTTWDPALCGGKIGLVVAGPRVEKQRYIQRRYDVRGGCKRGVPLEPNRWWWWDRGYNPTPSLVWEGGEGLKEDTAVSFEAELPVPEGWLTPCLYLVYLSNSGFEAIPEDCLPEFESWVRDELCEKEHLGGPEAWNLASITMPLHKEGPWQHCEPARGATGDDMRTKGVRCGPARLVIQKFLRELGTYDGVTGLIRGFDCYFNYDEKTRPILCMRGAERIRSPIHDY